MFLFYNKFVNLKKSKNIMCKSIYIYKKNMIATLPFTTSFVLKIEVNMIISYSGESQLMFCH